MALLSRVIAEASGGRCQRRTEKIRYTKGRRKGQENKGVGEGWKDAGIRGRESSRDSHGIFQPFPLGCLQRPLEQKVASIPHGGPAKCWWPY